MLAATKDTPGAEYDRLTVRGNCTHVFGGLASRITLSYTYFMVEQCRLPLTLLMTIPYLPADNSFDGARALAATKDTPRIEYDRRARQLYTRLWWAHQSNHAILHVLHG